MATKPIKPNAHVATDYLLGTLAFVAPGALGLGIVARTLSYVFGAAMIGNAAMTDTPLGVRRALTFRQHGDMDKPLVPSMVLLPYMAGAMRDPRARTYFSLFAAAALAQYLMTDYKARTAPCPPAIGKTPGGMASQGVGLSESAGRMAGEETMAEESVVLPDSPTRGAAPGEYASVPIPCESRRGVEAEGAV